MKDELLRLLCALSDDDLRLDEWPGDWPLLVLTLGLGFALGALLGHVLGLV